MTTMVLSVFAVVLTGMVSVTYACDGCYYGACYKVGDSTADGEWTCGEDGYMHSKPKPVKCDGCYYSDACRAVGDVVGDWKCQDDGKMHAYCGDGCYYGRCYKVDEKTADGKWTCAADHMMHG